MRTTLLTLVCLLAFASPILAQTNPIQIAKPFGVAFEPVADGSQVPTSWQCYLDGKPLGASLPAAARVCSIPGLSAGGHTIEVAGTNAFGEGAKGALTATAGAPPPAPTLRITAVTTAIFEVGPDGAVKLLASSVSIQP